MKKFLVLPLFLAFILAACDSGDKPVENLPAGYHGVVVEEAMNAQNYTYLRVTEDDKEYWIAVPQMEAKEGDVLYYSRSMEMKNFSSKTLNRTFESVLFVEDISKTPAQEPKIVEHPKVNNTPKANVSVEPLKDGNTIEQIYANRKELAGKTIRVRGMVTKYNPDIMNMNWLHIQDGTGKDHYDLAVTTKDNAENGKLVIVEGVVSLDRDYGSGYSYDLIIENAKVKVE
jgi:hypothetical protein